MFYASVTLALFRVEHRRTGDLDQVPSCIDSFHVSHYDSHQRGFDVQSREIDDTLLLFERELNSTDSGDVDQLNI